MALSPGREEGVCQARDCRRPARLIITWSNPKIPWSDSKTWLACGEHENALVKYMEYRGFPYEVHPINGRS
ncbi:hypothetical protein [Actinomyces mediterranea]|uniref:hypothetical protein n=1 Tax=Actinomyces mediterranea TaxID=1871028 RepID=UPI000970A564|nr:hypothetical protein [Actinomyces mediterranea]